MFQLLLSVLMSMTPSEKQSIARSSLDCSCLMRLLSSSCHFATTASLHTMHCPSPGPINLGHHYWQRSTSSSQDGARIRTPHNCKA